MRLQRGFTLVELVLVVVVTGLLAALAAGSLGVARQWQRANTAKRIGGDLSYARRMAQVTGRRTLWTFDSGAQSYVLGQEAAPGSGAIAAIAMTNPASGAGWSVRLAELSAGMTITSLTGVTGSLGFDAWGVPVDSAGAAMAADAVLGFSSGAQVVVKAVSGDVQWVWP